MIISFGDKQTEALAKGRHVPRFASFERMALRKLRQLEIAGRLDDLRVPPGNRLELLKGDRAGQMSIRLMTSGGYVLGGVQQDQKMLRL